MGSMISLQIGNLEVDWGKNNVFMNHGPLYQAGDESIGEYRYVAEDGAPVVERKEVYSRPLGKMVPRLGLLGCTLRSAEAEFVQGMRLHRFPPKHLPLSFDTFLDVVKSTDVVSGKFEYEGDYDFGELGRQMIRDLGLPVDFPSTYTVGQMLEGFSPWTLLYLLAQNPRNLALPVTWHFADVVENGWVERAEIVAGPERQQRFLLVTEGSSDSAVLKRALVDRRPEIADFFSFVDMEQGYPFTGTGNMLRFCQGLVSIGIRNRVLVAFDNDAAGCDALNRVLSIELPGNLRAFSLPDMPEFESVMTEGPSGSEKANINGRAASLECYLDVPVEAMRVRWANYVPSRDTYQGALVNGADHVRRFLRLARVDSDYDYSRLDAVLATIESHAVAVAEADADDV